MPTVAKTGSLIEFDYNGTHRKGTIEKFGKGFILVKIADNHYKSFTTDKIVNLKTVTL